MRNSKRGFWYQGLAAVTALTCVAWPLSGGLSSVEAAEAASAERAKAAISQVTGIPATEFTETKAAPLANTGMRQFKLLDAEGNLRGVTLDVLGQPVSEEEAERAVQESDNRGFVGK